MVQIATANSRNLAGCWYTLTNYILQYTVSGSSCSEVSVDSENSSEINEFLGCPKILTILLTLIASDESIMCHSKDQKTEFKIFKQIDWWVVLIRHWRM